MSSKKRRFGICGFCGEYKPTTREHVFPRGIYPKSSQSSKIQRITIAACDDCNSGTSDDDARFRNVVAMAGDATDAVNQLWRGPIQRGLEEVDGHRRAHDVFSIMRPAPDAGPNRYRIYPAEDERVLRSVRKIVRGLSRYHELSDFVTDEQVFADVQREKIPDEMLSWFKLGITDSDICRYGFISSGDVDGILSVWIIQFFGRTNFIAAICADEDTRATKFGK